MLVGYFSPSILWLFPGSRLGEPEQLLLVQVRIERRGLDRHDVEGIDRIVHDGMTRRRPAPVSRGGTAGGIGGLEPTGGGPRLLLRFQADEYIWVVPPALDPARISVFDRNTGAMPDDMPPDASHAGGGPPGRDSTADGKA